jgi:glycosyltransferase involved in cell wall biosynthesis
MTEPPPFTVAICTRNRARLLETCLESLCDSLGDGERVPVVVVDNGSLDATPKVVDLFAHRLSIVRVEEPTAGLSRARNRALDACSSPYIVFLDDDAKPAADWISAVGNGISEWNPDCFGGPYRPFYEHRKPRWFRDEYASMHLEKQHGLLRPGEVLSGGNMGWRVSLLRELGGFPEHLGMAGNRLRIGEETYLEFRLISERPEVRRVFLADMLIYHLASQQKTRLGYWIRREWTVGWMDDAVRLDPKDIPISRVVTEAVKAALLILGLPVRDRRKFPFWPNVIMERVNRKLRLLATVANRLYMRTLGRFR